MATTTLMTSNASTPWNCGACTYLNDSPSRLNKCEMCCTPRERSAKHTTTEDQRDSSHPSSQDSAKKVPTEPIRRVVLCKLESPPRNQVAVARVASAADETFEGNEENEIPRHGAYAIKGDYVARRKKEDDTSAVSMVVYEPRQEQDASQQASQEDEEKEICRETPIKSIQEEPVVAHVVSEDELEQDIRQRILKEQQDKVALENQVRQKILKEAVQAEVLKIDHHDSSNCCKSTTSVGSSIESLRPNSIKEHFFGDSRIGNVDIASTPEVIRSRTLLPRSVSKNETTKKWISSIQTNQKALECNDKAEAAKGCVTFSLSSRYEADRVCEQMAPPRMLPFSENPLCHICKTKFALFRRPCHCRNCGVCVCSSCSTTWQSRMVPETYNIKNASSVNICLACDWLSMSFRTALLKGENDKAWDLYKTGNINLTTPFANVKGEVFYPIHCAVLGGNLDLLKWLVDKHRCPIQFDASRPQLGGGNRKKRTGPILSSKSRSSLEMALTSKRIDYIRYLVSDKGMSFYEEKNLDMNVALSNFTTVLSLLPVNIAESKPKKCGMGAV